MGKGITMLYTRKGESRHRIAALLLISGAFLLGGLLGYWTEGRLPAISYVEHFLEAVREGAIEPSLQRELWKTGCWPVGILLLRFLPLTGISIPMIICLRGFLLSYSISAFMQVGVLHTFLLFGPVCVLTLPVLFLLSTEVLLRKAGEQSKERPGWILACLLALCLCVLLEYAVIPGMIKS